MSTAIWIISGQGYWQLTLEAQGLVFTLIDV